MKPRRLFNRLALLAALTGAAYEGNAAESKLAQSFSVSSIYKDTATLLKQYESKFQDLGYSVNIYAVDAAQGVYGFQAHKIGFGNLGVIINDVLQLDGQGLSVTKRNVVISAFNATHRAFEPVSTRGYIKAGEGYNVSRNGGPLNKTVSAAVMQDEFTKLSKDTQAFTREINGGAIPTKTLSQFK